MGHKEKFENYLRNESLRELSIKRYIGAFSFINTIAKKFNLSNIEDWEISELDNNIDIIKNDEEFIEKNSRGNNMYSASLNHFLKYRYSEKKQSENINEMKTPELPFDTFGWQWATTGIASHLNSPKSLKVVLDALLINGSGENNSNLDFKELVHRLCINKYRISESESDKLTKLSNPSPQKNIIENSANYWHHIGLLETKGNHAKVSKLGEDFLNGLISNDQFILDRIDKYFLPNNAYNYEETQKWNNLNVKIYPLKLIKDLFEHLYLNFEEDQQYLTENDLTNIVIPCSYDLEKFNLDFIAQHIIEFRKDPSVYSVWPKPQSTYTDDKGDRMANEFLYFLEVFGFLSSNKDNVRAGDKKYFATEKLIPNDFLSEKEDKQDVNTLELKPENFNLTSFKSACDNAGLIYSRQLLTRFAASLGTKPFVLLTGLSGSGKTKLAQAFAQWICESKEQYCIVPVGADWINREPLLGYVNALETDKYIIPENGALRLIIEANKKVNENKPYFLILDEMNLSHVERYFADFLSVMESDEWLNLHSCDTPLDGGNGVFVDKEYKWPDNLFVIGTVNIDETTYMFSPKVLDRANVIEFRISAEELNDYFKANNNLLDMKMLCEQDTNIGKGAKYGESFLTIAKSKEATKDATTLNEELKKFFGKLQEIGAEFGYRSVSEIQILFKKLDDIDISYSSRTNEKIDIAIMQKLLPKLHGSRSKLVDVLFVLASFCYDYEKEPSHEVLKKIFERSDKLEAKIKYPISLEKITRMYRNVIDNGFTSYAEA